MIISDLGKIVTGKTPSTKNLRNWQGSVPFITPKDLQKTKHIFKTERYISDFAKDSLKNIVLPSNSVCVSCIGNIGYVAMTTEESITNQQINSIIVNDANNADYVYYLMKSLESYFKNYEGQSTTLSILNKTQFSKISIPSISIEKQKKIANILSSLDNKIELNLRINDNLEKQMELYFRYLFIDNINSNWEIGCIADIGTVIGGGTPSKAKSEYYTNNGIAWITPKDLSNQKSKFISRGENDITELGLKNSSAKIMPKGTILFSSRAPIGYIAIANNDITTNQGFKSIIPNIEFGTSYIYYLLKQNIPIIESMASGSTFKEVSGKTMKEIPVIIPDLTTLATFNNFCNKLFEKQKNLEKESLILANIRNYLLNILMSNKFNFSKI